jgi:enoyl-CoA hydratase/carnithine racemase
MLLEPADVAALIALPGAARDVSVLREQPFVAIDLREGPTDADLAPLRSVPVVSIGVGGECASCDVVVDDHDGLVQLAQAIERNPQAAVTLVQLLRMNEHLDPLDALVAESLAYATLQGGGEFATWLTSRGNRVRPPEAEPPVLVERHDDVLHVELNRPRLHNLYNAAMRDALGDALAIAAADDSVRAVVLSGRGKSFSAGGDLAEFGTVTDSASAHLIRTTANVAPLCVAIGDRLHAEVHGAAVGAGCEIAAFAGHVLATADATFRLPEVSMGLVPGAGGTVSVPRRMGRQRAAWMMLTGEVIDAHSARDWGLVDEIGERSGHARGEV